VAHKHRILLVDDEFDIATTLKMGLEMQGFQVDTFTEPRLAIEKFKPEYYDLCLIDVRMSGMSGFDLARNFWLVDPKAKVCFLTAFEIHEFEANKVFKSLNTKCFLKKPISAKKLAAHVHSHLSIEVVN
jgi:DNA-binding response OmpR family regulator